MVVVKWAYKQELLNEWSHVVTGKEGSTKNNKSDSIKIQKIFLKKDEILSIYQSDWDNTQLFVCLLYKNNTML